MKRLVITLDASRDLSEISDYFLAQSVEAGDRFVENLATSVSISPNSPIWGALTRNCLQACEGCH